MSLASLLSIARSALLAHQKAMSVTANNIANAQTPGYSRQRLDLVPQVPLVTPLGTLGRGVTDDGVRRVRDRFLDATYWRESGSLGGSGTLLDYLGRVEAAMNEPSDSGVSAALDGLFNAFADLSNDPPSGPNREIVRQAAQRLVQLMHGIDQQISQATDDAFKQMQADVNEVNQIGTKIAALNTQILAAGGPNHTAPDLEDQRDLLVDRLSSLASVRVLDRGNGTIAVLAGGTMLVDGGNAQAFEVQSLSGGGFGVSLKGGGATIAFDSGSLKALSDLTTTTLPGLRSQMDQLAQSLVTQVNALHRTGYTATGATGIDFFDPAGVTAGTIALSSAVTSSADAIAAGSTPDSGSGAIALQLSQLGKTPIAALGNKSLGEFYIGVASSLGAQSHSASDDTDAHQTLLDRADSMRSSVSGVSVEEEMSNLISQQQAYGAAARLIKVAEDMMDDLMNNL